MKHSKILLVEDDQVSAKIYTKLLGLWGYEVHHANDSHLALQMIEDQEYDLLLTDNQLPFMSGTELIARVSKQCPEMMVLMLTGDDRLNVSGFNHTVLMKPVMPDFLRFQIEHLLENQALRQSA